MIYLTYALIVNMLALFVLWVFYLAEMNLERANENGQLTRVSRIGHAVVRFLFLALDTYVNVFIMTLVFWEWPREALVSRRLERHLRCLTGWRKRLARSMAEHLLDAFDPSGNHCNTPK